MSKGILITGATGKQGGATIDALISTPSGLKDFTILAVTRNPTSPSAQHLASKAPNIKIVQGDLNDIPSLFRTAKTTHPNIWGVFSVQTFLGQGQSVHTEEIQGKALVDEALASNVSHFVYTSVSRGSESETYTTPTEIPHFKSKHNIEHHLVDQSAGTAMSYTILRPVGFMDNWTPDTAGKMFGAMWTAALPRTKKLQLVATADIGHFAAQAFLNPEGYRNRALSLAGDELTFEQASAVFREKTGRPAPATYSFLGSALMWGVKELGTMFRWFATDGYHTDIPALRKEHPGLLTLGDWIEKKSAFVKR